MYWFFYSSEYFYILIYLFKVLNPLTASLNEWLGTKDQNKIAYFYCLKGNVEKIKQDREAEQYLVFLLRWNRQ